MKIFSPILKGTTTVAQGTTNLSGSFTGSLFGTAATASYADNFTVGGTLTAQTINVQIITSSIEFNTGSTRNGALSTNTHQFTGSVLMSGSLSVDGASTFSNVVGIGTSPNLRQLQVTTLSDGNYASGIAHNGNNSSSYGLLVQAGTNSTDASLRVMNKGGSSDYLFVRGDGSVGIGTTTPSGGISGNELALHLAHSNVSILALQSTAVSGKKWQIYSSNEGSLYFRDGTTGTQVFNLQTSGNVLIGTTTDGGYKLEVAGTMYVSNTFTANSKFSGYNTDGLFSANARPSEIITPSGVGRIRLGYNDYGAGQYWGRIGFFGTTNWSLGHVGSAGDDFSIGVGFRGTAFYIYSNNNYSFAGSNVSDSRKKANINYITSNQLDTILKLKPASFNQKDLEGNINSNTHTGFIAQDVLEENIPNLIHGSDEGGYGLDYNGVLALAVKAIQELKSENDTLKEILQRNNIQ
jgi:hypothetical protein